MKKIWIVCCLCVLCGCSSSSQIIVPKGIQDFTTKNNEVHRNIETDVSRLKAFENVADKASIQEYNSAIRYVINHSTKTNGQRVVTRAEAIQDTNKLFSLLKTLYGLYPLYPQQMFIEAQTSIIRKLKTNETVAKKEFASLIRESLSFLSDNHFQVDFEPLVPYIPLYKEKNVTYKNHTFKKKEDKYYYKQNTSAIQRISIPLVTGDIGLEVEEVLRPVLQSDGSIEYQLYISSKQIKEYNVKEIQLELENKNIVSIAIEETLPEKKGDQVVEQKEIEGIPYLHINRMIYEKEGEQQKEQAQEFIESAKTFANSKVAILDLRGNLGGNSMLIYHWAQEYTNEKMAGYGMRVLYMPMQDLDFKKICEENTVQILDELTTYAHYKRLNKMTYFEDVQIMNTSIKKDTTLFVLQDRNSASASEMLMDVLHRVDNVIFVGTNSNGSVESSAMVPFYLENSGIEIRFGNMAGFFDKDYAKEFYGMEPDVWIDSENCVEYVKYLMKS